MLGGGSPREELLADGAPAHALANDDEHLADLVGVREARASLGFIVSSHKSRNYALVTNVLQANSTVQPQEHQQWEAVAAWSLCHHPSPG